MSTTLGGRYEIVRELGAGGMGRVFQSIDTQTGRAVAAKVLITSESENVDAILRFHQEGALLSTLKHPNIVQVFSTFLEENTSCIIMELLEGRSLGQILKAERLPLHRIKRIAMQVAEALAYAHSRGIIHRDIKPDNIMVIGDDHVKVTDFGIARIANPTGTLATLTMTKAGMTVGTPLYMAPEQIEGRQLDGRSDMYALGAVLYQMVTGRPPFEGEDPLTIAFKHVHKAPAPPSEINETVPQDWEALILKILSKDPADRYQSASALGQALAELSERAAPSAPATDAFPTVGFTPPPAAPWPGETAPVSAPAPEARTPTVQAGTPAPTVGAQPEAAPAVQPATAPGPPARPWWPIAAVGAVLVVIVVAALVFLTRGGSTPKAVPTATTTVSPTSLLKPVAEWGSRGQSPGQYVAPQGVGVDSSGDVVVADTGNNRIQELAPSSDPLTEWGTLGSEISQLDGPAAVAIDGRGNVYVADTNNSRVQKFSSSGKLLNAWGSQGTGSDQLDHPRGIAVDAHGHVYVADTGNNRIQEFSTSGTPIGPWGSQGTQPGQFNQPWGVAVSARGDIYVADAGNNRIQVFAASTDPLDQWGKSGSAAGEFNQPRGVALDARGMVYVADTGNHRVQQLTASGTPRAMLGSQGSGRGQFQRPTALAVDNHDTVYVADTGNNRIVKLAAS